MYLKWTFGSITYLVFESFMHASNYQDGILVLKEMVSSMSGWEVTVDSETFFSVGNDVLKALI